MRNTLIVLFSILSLQGFSQLTLNPECSLLKEMAPLCYHKRESVILNISLLHYGNTMTVEHLSHIGELLKERFNKATQRKIELNIKHTAILPLAQKMSEGFKWNDITDKERLHRIWYYENLNVRVLEEAYNLYRQKFPDIINGLDNLLIITSAQFDALSYASGRVSATEYPQEIAWNLPDGGRTEYPSDYYIVDGLIHELGHNMFLGHSATPCSKKGLTRIQKKECIKNSPNANDIMSYHRTRNKVNENHMHSFESCNMKIIEDKIIPAMLSGGKWRISGRTNCK